uniref:Ovule protein n=1 Tax=Ascaris lumbricoides TaxID=6252 RepID=A0A0M3HFM0_ASCLU
LESRSLKLIKVLFERPQRNIALWSVFLCISEFKWNFHCLGINV